MCDFGLAHVLGKNGARTMYEEVSGRSFADGGVGAAAEGDFYRVAGTSEYFAPEVALHGTPRREAHSVGRHTRKAPRDPTL